MSSSRKTTDTFAQPNGALEHVAKNTGLLFVARMITASLGILYLTLAARHLGPNDFGVLTFALAFTSIFGILCDFGLQPLLIRELARDRSLTSKYLANILGMKVILVAVAFAMMAVTINLMGNAESKRSIVYLLGLAVVFNGFTLTFYGVFHAHEKMGYQSLGQIVQSLLMFLGVVVGVPYGMGVIGFGILYGIVNALVLVLSIWIFKTRFPHPFLLWSQQKMEADRDFWTSTVKEALPFGLALGFMMVFYWIDTIMLSVMKGDAVVGWYNAAYRMVMVLLFIPQALIAAIYPVMARQHSVDASALAEAHEISFRYLVILGIPLGIGTTLLAGKLVFLIFGPAYQDAVIPLQILVWSSVLIFMSMPFGNVCNSMNRQSIVTLTTGICGVINVVLNLGLIPRYSLIGASIATVATELISLVLLFIFSYRMNPRVYSRTLGTTALKALGASVVMGTLILSLGDRSLMMIVPLGALAYGTILWLGGGVTRNDILFVKEIWG